MYLRGNPLGPSTPQYEDYHLAAAVGIVLAAYVGFFFALYWLMQPTVSATSAFWCDHLAKTVFLALASLSPRAGSEGMALMRAPWFR
jgi:hypothetical protein